MEKISIRLPKEMSSKLEETCNKYGYTKSEWIRMLIRKELFYDEKSNK